MSHNGPGKHIEWFATSPQSRDVPKDLYVERVAQVARWSEECGCKGILVYTDNGIADPWLVSKIIIENTKHLCPLVAVQPVYMHPYTVAKMLSSFGYLFGRRLYLNMVAGGFKNDLTALNDTTPHDKRYTRLIEYTTIIKKLLQGSAPVTFEGEFYQVKNLSLVPSLAPELFPGIFMSGSSEAGLEAAITLGVTAVKYPRPPEECATEPPTEGLDCGIRVGIVARKDEDEAWEVAEERFPEDRKGELAHKLAMSVSDSHWHKQLSETAKQVKSVKNPYWMRPFETYKTFCPYLVGSYDTVARELSRYAAIGYRTFILDIPPSEEELRHINTVFKSVQASISR